MIGRLKYILFFVLMYSEFYSQEPIFTQFCLNPIYVNPALAGYENNFKLSTNQRFQWPNIPSQFNTTTVALDSWQNMTNSGFSSMYTRNIEGEGSLTTTTFSSGLAYRLFDKGKSPVKVQVGFQYQHIRKRIDWSRLVFSDELDALYGDIFSSAFIPPDLNSYHLNNLSLGGVFTYRIRKGVTRIGRNYANMDLDSELGFAVHNFVQRRDGFIFPNQLSPIKYTVHGSFLMNVYSRRASTGIRPNFIYQQYDNNDLKTAQIGLDAMMYPLNYGIFYRHQMSTIRENSKPRESLGFIIGYRKNYSSNMSITFSYSADFTISQLGGSTAGTHEFVLVIESITGGLFSGLINENRRKKFKERPMPCYDKFNPRSVINTNMGPLDPNPKFKTNND